MYQMRILNLLENLANNFYFFQIQLEQANKNINTKNNKNHLNINLRLFEAHNETDTEVMA